jgi:CDP-4-dehydro-6-deoxyglucose reductase
MPDPKFAKPWHGVPREEIDWWPTVNEDVCIGCGTCVVGCGRQVYKFDFERKKAVVADPMNCMVGCTTCAVSCPTSAISFPSTDLVLQLGERPEVRHAIEDALISRREELAFGDLLPDSDHLVQMEIRSIVDVSEGTRLFTLTPHRPEDCMCQFTPGQYLEIWIPGTEWMSRAYSIGNAPHEDGSVELHIRKVEGGRLSEWAFGPAAVGDVVTTRGPAGAFTMRSPGDRPLVFVARGTGFAPIKAIMEQQLQMFPERPMALFWGVTESEDFYAIETLEQWLRQDPNLHMTLVARRFDGFRAPDGSATVSGRVSDAVASSGLDLAGYDAYVAGPRHTVVDVVAALQQRGVQLDRILADSYGT